jgi:hypothetical protein
LDIPVVVLGVGEKLWIIGSGAATKPRVGIVGPKAAVKYFAKLSWGQLEYGWDLASGRCPSFAAERKLLLCSRTLVYDRY